MKISEIKKNNCLSHDASNDSVFFKIKSHLTNLRHTAYSEYINNHIESRDVSFASAIFFLIASGLSLILSGPVWLSISMIAITSVSMVVVVTTSMRIIQAKQARKSQREYGIVCETAFTVEDRAMIRDMVELHFSQFTVSTEARTSFSSLLDTLISDMPDISRVSIRALIADLKLLEQNIETKDSLEKLKQDLNVGIPNLSGLTDHIKAIQKELTKVVDILQNGLADKHQHVTDQQATELVGKYNKFCCERECLSQVIEWSQHDRGAVVDEIMRLKKVADFIEKQQHSSESTAPVFESLKRTHFCHDVLNNHIPVDIDTLRDKINQQLASLECVYRS